MEENKPTGSFDNDTIAAISTSLGEAGIGIVRMSGPHAFFIADQIFYPVSGGSFKKEDNRRLRYGWIKADNGEVIDEVLVSFMMKPHTYTREDIVEINCHGGAVSVKRVLDLLLSKGARLAERGEFTRRAFLNGRLDLSQAEAVLDVIDAKTARAQSLAENQLRGSVSKAMGELKEEVLQLLSQVEYSINFMDEQEEDIPLPPLEAKAQSVLRHMDESLEKAKSGRLLREGIGTVIVGKPNVGKSSLLNTFLQSERAIVTDIPGTTRDAIEESYDLDGILLRLIDTAGIRTTEDRVESIGVEKSKSLLSQADLVLALFDGSRPMDEEDRELIDLLKGQTVIMVINKADLGICEEMRQFQADYQSSHPTVPWVSLSALRGDGLDDLKQAILQLFFQDAVIEDDSAVLTNLRQVNLLKEARQYLFDVVQAFQAGVSLDALEVDLRASYLKLLEITGEGIGDEVLDTIFQDFCIGK